MQNSKGMCCLEASFMIGFGVSGRVLTKLQRLYVFFKRLLRWDVEVGEGEGSRCLWNRRQEGAGPTSPPRRAVMWGMKQIPAALAQKRLNLGRHTNNKGRHRGLPLHFFDQDVSSVLPVPCGTAAKEQKERYILEQLF